MANENLQNALEQAGLTPEQFAEVIQVDPKSVARWVSGNTLPYPRHRRAISHALDLSEQDLWPDRVGTEAGTDPSGSDQATTEAGGVCDVVAAWAYADDQGAPDLVAFIETTDGPIDVFDPYSDLELPGELVDALASQAAAGRQVRILTDQPTVDFWALEGNEHVQVLADEIDLSCCWFIRAGDRMLWAISLADDPQVFSPPVLELRRNFESGLFDRLQDKFQELWELAEEHDINILSQSISSAGTQDQGTDPRQPQAPGAASVHEDQAPEPGQRRWPGRPT